MKKQLDFSPGRYLVEVRHDGGSTQVLVNATERVGAGGDRGPSLHLPGLHAWFDALEDHTQEEIRRFIEDDDDE